MSEFFSRFVHVLSRALLRRSITRVYWVVKTPWIQISEILIQIEQKLICFADLQTLLRSSKKIQNAIEMCPSFRALQLSLEDLISKLDIN